MEKLKTFNNARLFAEKKLLREFWYDKLIEDPDLLTENIPDFAVQTVNKWMKCKGKSRFKYVMFTINFKEGINMKLVEKKITKCVEKKWIKTWIYSYEWRGDNKGMHIHLRCEITDGKKCYECKREVFNTFKHLVGNKKHVDAVYSNREGAFIDYVKGLRKGKNKNNFIHDKNMRKLHKLPTYISNGC